MTEKQMLPAKAPVPDARRPLGLAGDGGASKVLERQRAEEAINILCDEIARRRIAPGSRITQQDLCDRFLIARPTAREILAALQQRNLVQLPPNRSATVIQMTRDDIVAILNIREVLEGLSVRLAVESGDPERWQELVELFGEPMDRIIEQGDIESYLQNIEIFSQRVRGAWTNPMLAGMLRAIEVKSWYIIRRTIALPNRIPVGISEFRAVIAAMRRGDGNEAERLRRLNIRSQRETFMKHEQLIGGPQPNE